jgi:hypothetical protein
LSPDRCHQCGAETRRSNYCTVCGTRLWETEAQPPSFFQRGKGFWLLILALVIMVAAAGSLVLSCRVLMPVVRSTPIGQFFAENPSDEQMIREFKKDRFKFEELLQMFQAGTYANDQASRVRYEELARQLKVSVPDGLDSELWLVRSSVGLSVSGSSKSFVYSEMPPSPLVENTDDAAWEEPVGEAYRRIEGNWYIEYDWDA